MNSTSTPTPAPALVPNAPTTARDPLVEARLEVGRASAEISAIDAELTRLTGAKAQATARFNFACQQFSQLKQKEATT
jgi:hypothetical protein